MPPKGVVARLPRETQKLGPSCTQSLSFTTFGQLPQSGVSVATEAVIEGIFAKTQVIWRRFTLTPIDSDPVGNMVHIRNKMTGETVRPRNHAYVPTY